MDIYVVQPGDTIEEIANMYEITVEKLIRDNELVNPDNLHSFAATFSLV